MQNKEDLFSTLDDEDSVVTSYLNHASLSKIREQDQIDFIRSLKVDNVISISKQIAKRVLGLDGHNELYFARNTTEAFAISIDYLTRNIVKPKVSLPIKHYSSIKRAVKERFNYGEKNKDTTYSTLEEDYTVRVEPTENEVFLYEQTKKGIEEHMLDFKPDVVVFNRTDRVSGIEQNTMEYVNLIREIASSLDPNYKPFIISDSAQTLTTTNEFHIPGVDAQVGCFHKGLGSFHPLGFAIIKNETYDDLAKFLEANPNDYYPSRNTFIREEGISKGIGEVNIESFFCFIETLNYLRERGLITGVTFNSIEDLIEPTDIDFNNLIAYRHKLYEYAYFKLRATDKVKIKSDFPTIASGYILSFEVGEMCNLTPRGFTKVMKDHGIYITHISDSNEVRISFGPDNIKEDIDRLIDYIEQYL